jgi:hypothetical protein
MKYKVVKSENARWAVYVYEDGGLRQHSHNYDRTSLAKFLGSVQGEVELPPEYLDKKALRKTELSIRKVAKRPGHALSILDQKALDLLVQQQAAL